MIAFATKASFAYILSKGTHKVDNRGRQLKRLKQWCDDVNKKNSGIIYSWLFVKQDEYEKYKQKTL